MELHWKDKYDDLENWSHLEVTVSGAPKPVTRLESGVNKKFRLVSEQNTLFWGKMDYDFCWVSYMYNSHVNSNKIIAPISSNDVESVGSDLKNWSRYFLEALKNSLASPLFDSIWHISSTNHKPSDFQPPTGDPKWHVFETTEVFDRTNPVDLHWGISGGFELLRSKDEPDSDLGRVKWYRKLVAQGKCPPILVWYFNSLQAFVIIDGHCRLKAFLDKKEKPELLVLSTVYNIDPKRNPKIQKDVWEAMEKRKKHPHKPAMPLEKVNKLLIEVYDTRPLQQVFTKSQASSELEKSWNKEVELYCRENSVSQEDLDFFISDQ